jgi:signal transduction histidine kinase
MENTEALTKEIQKLKESNTLKQDLISVTAHQLRTSLSAIKWVIEMILDKDTGPLTAEQEGLLKKATASNERMIALVSDLLQFNHAEDILHGYTFAPIQLTELIESVIFEFTSETKKRGVELIFLKPETALSPVTADEAKLRIVIENLIENAIKYSKPGDTTFVSIEKTADTIRVNVKDTGIGISEEDRAHIFEKFFRAPNAVSHALVGSGLGLFTSKRIMERHSGTLGFEPNTPHGTTFYFSLPAH